MLKRQVRIQAAKSLTMVPARDPEKSPSPEDLAIAPFGLVLSQAKDPVEVTPT